MSKNDKTSWFECEKLDKSKEQTTLLQQTASTTADQCNIYVSSVCTNATVKDIYTRNSHVSSAVTGVTGYGP